MAQTLRADISRLPILVSIQRPGASISVQTWSCTSHYPFPLFPILFSFIHILFHPSTPLSFNPFPPFRTPKSNRGSRGELCILLGNRSRLARFYVLVNVNSEVRIFKTRAMLSQGWPRDAAVNFDRYRILQRHRAVSLPQHGFLIV